MVEYHNMVMVLAILAVINFPHFSGKAGIDSKQEIM